MALALAKWMEENKGICIIEKGQTPNEVLLGMDFPKIL
jgi:hypothetical protein